MTKTNEQSEHVSPVKVTQPLWRRAAKKTGKVLDWTVLPITELKKLKASVSLLGVFVYDAFKAMVSLFKRTDKVSFKDSKKNLNTFCRHDLYFNSLNEERQKMIEELPLSFFVKRTMSVGFCVAVCVFALVSSLIGLYSYEFHIIRGTISVLMVFLLIGYTWLSITSLENIAYSYKRIKYIDKSMWRVVAKSVIPACKSFLHSVALWCKAFLKNIVSIMGSLFMRMKSLFVKGGSQDGSSK